jgi:hypothetical protein
MPGRDILTLLGIFACVLSVVPILQSDFLIFEHFPPWGNVLVFR